MNKEKIVEACFVILNEKVEQVNLAIHDANQSLQDDTKSSAGDKYETSREMIQQDLNRYEQQLKALNQEVEILNSIKIQKTDNGKAVLGSIIETDKAIYFLATSIGLVHIEAERVFSISTASPIGKVLVGKSVGESFEFNGERQVIKSLF
ncbi:MAG: GreA/GreB family elongation factor [Sphingobacterium composti]|uniref:GreA/GreB family elongation factor n=1 Tax=Sphingobacterium composti TaxID=363260 RepID=UPI00135BE80C|nr:GreA/GreB family elongation factor [Sphingobacterium composti Ten et al. 2007 non Yoo et al. 2007]